MIFKGSFQPQAFCCSNKKKCKVHSFTACSWLLFLISSSYMFLLICLSGRNFPIPDCRTKIHQEEKPSSLTASVVKWLVISDSSHCLATLLHSLSNSVWSWTKPVGLSGLGGWIIADSCRLHFLSCWGSTFAFMYTSLTMWGKNRALGSNVKGGYL